MCMQAPEAGFLDGDDELNRTAQLSFQLTSDLSPDVFTSTTSMTQRICCNVLRQIKIESVGCPADLNLEVIEDCLHLVRQISPMRRCPRLDLV